MSLAKMSPSAVFEPILESIGLGSSTGINTTGVGTAVDTTNFEYVPFLTNTAPSFQGPLLPGPVVPIFQNPIPDPLNWRGAPEWWGTISKDFLPTESERKEPDIPMAPPTNKRRIRLRD